MRRFCALGWRLSCLCEVQKARVHSRPRRRSQLKMVDRRRPRLRTSSYALWILWHRHSCLCLSGLRAEHRVTFQKLEHRLREGRRICSAALKDPPALNVCGLCGTATLGGANQIIYESWTVGAPACAEKSFSILWHRHSCLCSLSDH
jgi:hypothetical protein